jgi:hypothetical protein
VELGPGALPEHSDRNKAVADFNSTQCTEVQFLDLGDVEGGEDFDGWDAVAAEVEDLQFVKVDVLNFFQQRGPVVVIYISHRLPSCSSFTCQLVILLASRLCSSFHLPSAE